MLGLFLVAHKLQVLLLEVYQSYISMYTPSNIYIPIAVVLPEFRVYLALNYLCAETLMIPMHLYQ
jgi:hypothetical protein